MVRTAQNRILHFGPAVRVGEVSLDDDLVAAGDELLGVALASRCHAGDGVFEELERLVAAVLHRPDDIDEAVLGVALGDHASDVGVVELAPADREFDVRTFGVVQAVRVVEALNIGAVHDGSLRADRVSE